MSPVHKSETSVAAPVVGFLDAAGWDVYQEVQPEMWSGVADIVAVRNGKVWIVEVKRTLGFALMAQAENWTHHANFVSVAVPRGKWTKGRAMAFRLLGMLGIGCLEVSEFDGVEIKVDARDNDVLGNYAERLIAILQQEHKTYAAAGTPTGRRWSQFKATCARLRKIVEAEPGITFTRAINALEHHHYSSDASAKANLRKWAKADMIPGVRVEWRRDRMHLEPTDKPTPKLFMEGTNGIEKKA